LLAASRFRFYIWVSVPADLLTQLQSSLGNAYLIERELGGGGMSRVFIAMENRLRRRVVVKVLAGELAAGINAERFEREIQVAASLQQANIVPVLSAGDTNGIPWYTMPFVEGQSLRARLDTAGALPLSEVMSILRDVARALEFAHARGVVHRDIKPDNVLLSGGTAVVTDFGIAKALSAAREAPGGTLTQIGMSLGTPAYMAPEQAAGDPTIDHRADLYALGVLAYELLAEHTPFHDRSPQRMLAAHITEAPQPIQELRPDAPAALGDLVMQLLEKDPANRPASAAEVGRMLDATPMSDTLAAMPAMLLGRPGAWKRALVAYIIAFAVVAILARAAVTGLGLPDWVFTGALIVMALGLPVIIATAYVHRVSRRLATMTPRLTTSGGVVAPKGVEAIAAKAGHHFTWRRAALGGAYALAAFVLVVGGFMALRALGIGPAGSLLAAGKLSDDDRILVADFRVSGADSSLGHIASEAVRTELGQSKAVSVVSTSAVTAALRRMERPPNARVDLQLAREVAIREGIEAVLHGEISAVGDGFLIVLRLSAAESGDELAVFRETADSPRDLIPALDELSRELRGRIGESLKTVRAAPPLAQVTTSSLDALRKYVSGTRAMDVEGDYPRAISLLQQAVQVDTAFAMAYRKLGVAHRNSGIGPLGSADTALNRAFRFRDRLTDRERLLTEGSFYGSGRVIDRQRAAAAYEQLLEIDPTNSAALNNLGNIYKSRREFDKAETVYRRAVESGQATSISYGNLQATLFDQGKLAAQDSVYREMKRRFPNVPGLALNVAPRLYHDGNVDSIRTLIQQERSSSDPQSRIIALSVQSDLAVLHGRLRESLQLIGEVRKLLEARGVPPLPIYDSLTAAADDIWLREKPEAGIRRMDAALARTPLESIDLERRPYFDLTALNAIAGRTQEARAMLARYDREMTDTALRRMREPGRRTMLGLIALAEHRPADAITELRVGDSYPDGPANDCNICLDPLLGLAFERANLPDSAIAAYERYLRTPKWGRLSRNLDGTWLASTLRRLGSLYEERGDAGKATEYYTRFVTLWKDADPDLQPRVAAVKRRLEALRVREQ
jgi:tetratricopeptide (TPR) repeat protein/tRNA A-37 threonylcarbamoyl transferase component Bud32